MKLLLAASLALNIGLAIAWAVSSAKTKLLPDAPSHTAMEVSAHTTTDHHEPPAALDDGGTHEYQPVQQYQSSRY